ncbi:unnamed protein product [Ostreobium quekettii]|uniref:Uncharacterized protein n=1 Tax=Ostreobium quekettii TaxID=121088 RepID=A0A8S1INK1_9CHLO|nr:unnamed protein product [Ostreobium quekettii]
MGVGSARRRVCRPFRPLLMQFRVMEMEKGPPGRSDREVNTKESQLAVVADAHMSQVMQRDSQSLKNQESCPGDRDVLLGCTAHARRMSTSHIVHRLVRAA